MDVCFRQIGKLAPTYSYPLLWTLNVLLVGAFFLLLLCFCFASTKYTASVLENLATLSHGRVMLLGLLNALNATLTTLTNPWVPGIMQTLLDGTLLRVPLVMILSLVLFRARYSWLSWLSVVILLAGYVFVVVPPLVVSSSDHQRGDNWIASSLFASAVIPLVVSTMAQGPSGTRNPSDPSAPHHSEQSLCCTEAHPRETFQESFCSYLNYIHWSLAPLFCRYVCRLFRRPE